jgi:hypothetical protein
MARALTRKQLFDIANAGYPDGFLSNYYTRSGGIKKGRYGDTLADFVIKELADTFTTEATRAEQLTEAIRVMNSAIRDINGVIDALNDAKRNPDDPITDNEIRRQVTGRTIKRSRGKSHFELGTSAEHN